MDFRGCHWRLPTHACLTCNGFRQKLINGVAAFVEGSAIQAREGLVGESLCKMLRSWPAEAIQ
jgi:hypothetical protein